MRGVLGALAALLLLAATGCSAPTAIQSDAAVVASPSASPSIQSALTSTPPGFTLRAESRTDLRNYGDFTYMTATTTGLDPEAAAVADEQIEMMVASAVDSALKDDAGECAQEGVKCGFFQQTLKPLPCTDGYLCLQQDVAVIRVGSATSDAQVKVLVLEPTTGRVVPVSQVVPDLDRAGFITDVNDLVRQVQKQNDVYDPNFEPNLSESDITAWAPLPDGINVWFSKYAAGPGVLGVVNVSVPYPNADTPVTPDPPRSAISLATIKSGAAQVCEELGYINRARDLSAVRKDFNNDGLRDAIAGFTCQPNEGVPEGMLFYWLSSGPPGDYPRIAYGFSDAYSVNGIRWIEGTVEVETEESWGTSWRRLKWNQGDWKVVYEDVSAEPASDTPPVDSEVQATERPTIMLVTVPRLVGMRNKDAESLLLSLGLQFLIQPQIGDPSIAAQATNDCVVNSQQVAAGTQVERGTMIWATMQCPNTGYNSP